MSYADIVSTIALIGAIFSIGWQIYTWLHQEKREEATALKVYVCRRERHDTRENPTIIGVLSSLILALLALQF